MRNAVLSLGLLLISVSTAWSKGTGILRGKITNEAGNQLAPQVLLSNTKQPDKKLIATGGNYQFRDLDAGTYTVTIAAIGYESQRYVGVKIKDGKTIVLNTKLSKAGAWGSSVVSKVYREPVASPSYRGDRKVSMGMHLRGGAGTRRIRHLELGESAGRTMTAPAPSYEDMAIDGALGAGMAAPVEAVPLTEPPSKKGEILSLASSEKIYVSEPLARAGTLTSGEINDFSKWTLWEDISLDALKGYRSSWMFRPEARYTVIIKSKEGTPLANARVKMSNSGSTVWEAMTDNTGKAELWYGMWDTGKAAIPHLNALVDYNGKVYNMSNLKAFGEGNNIINTQMPCMNTAKLDIAFIVDATGSMQDEINYLKAELRDILQKVKDSMPRMQVQTAAMFYRDLEDEYLTRTSDLSADFNKTEAFIADNNADGGGDFPEGVDAALEEGLTAIHWRSDASVRLAFLVLDAPPHGDAATVKRMQELAARYAARGIRLIPVVCSGSDKSNEYLMRSLALATNGTYLFLTDHSGVGGSHTAPSTDKYDVEYLNGLIYRVIYQCSYMPECKPSNIQPDSSVVHQPTGVDSVRMAIDWKYYPNPTTGVLHIEHTGTRGDMYICDISGKAIMRFTANPSGRTIVDVGQYPAGVYFLRYNYEGDKWLSGRFVVYH